MFVGHLAVALGAKKVEPEVPLAAAVAAAFGLDLLWPVLLLLGVETVRVAPGDTAFTQLAFESYPWSHSLLLTLLWSALAAAAARALLGSRRAALVVGALVLSHWVLDLVTHRPDLPLWPAGPRAGFGLWSSVPATIAVEGALFAGAIAAWLSMRRPRDRTGTWSFVGLLALTTVLWVASPWAPPPPSASAVAWGALALWILVPWAAWSERHWVARGEE
ncbi:MAG TPA: hypothetical protein VLA09_10710 [Longimicrobiales bacterium]|nr:hypothetical protein [Longimicrobiales bacterium]